VNISNPNADKSKMILSNLLLLFLFFLKNDFFFLNISIFNLLNINSKLHKLK